MAGVRIVEMNQRDIRFPTSRDAHGSDAMHPDPDYSCVYVVLKTNSEHEGCGFTFTCGNGNDIVSYTVKSYSKYVVGKNLRDIVDNFGDFYHSLTGDSQLRWLGPEKGVVQLAAAAVLNAIWDLWAKVQNKPVWKLLVDLTPDQLVSTIDFTYITDIITPAEAIELLTKMQEGKDVREAEMLAKGYPAYTTSCGWMGYSDDKIILLCKEALGEGFTMFKVKVGSDLEDDKKRLKIVRDHIGPDKTLMIDANQKWGVQEAIDWVTALSQYNLHWIEEPTSPDDILGHAAIAKALNPLGIGVATGEHCHNRVMFKQFLQSGAMQFCQVDACRPGSLNEVIAVLLMAAKVNVPVCPHGGGVGLCELIQHISIFDYIAVSGSLNNRVTEYVDHLHEHYVYPVVMKEAHYQVPQAPGYSADMKATSLDDHEYPTGKVWCDLQTTTHL